MICALDKTAGRAVEIAETVGSKEPLKCTIRTIPCFGQLYLQCRVGGSPGPYTILRAAPTLSYGPIGTLVQKNLVSSNFDQALIGPEPGFSPAPGRIFSRKIKALFPAPLEPYRAKRVEAPKRYVVDHEVGERKH